MSKRCPICKEGSMRLETDYKNKSDGYHIIYAYCPMCNARTSSYPSMNVAQQAWNDGKISRSNLYQANIFEPTEDQNG
jgi:hypothetical protein